MKNAGLLDISVDAESIAKEIIKCVDMAIDGIHAFLFVLSVRIRFSREEEYAFKCLFELFGSKISDHMIVVFTGGVVEIKLTAWITICMAAQSL